ncbi:hypothetical protein RAA17_11980 [Komagataeibacter rhaeticus]|nr:hypothetical protein [Komagataeibacter rhaeticus]
MPAGACGVTVGSVASYLLLFAFGIHAHALECPRESTISVATTRSPAGKGFPSVHWPWSQNANQPLYEYGYDNGGDELVRLARASPRLFLPLVWMTSSSKMH